MKPAPAKLSTLQEKLAEDMDKQYAEFEKNGWWWYRSLNDEAVILEIVPLPVQINSGTTSTIMPRTLLRPWLPSATSGTSACQKNTTSRKMEQLPKSRTR